MMSSPKAFPAVQRHHRNIPAGEDLAAFDASEVGSGKRDRTTRRWQAHHGAGVGALHEPLG